MQSLSDYTKRRFVNESNQSTILQRLLSRGDKFTKDTILGHVTWDAKEGLDLSRVTDDMLTVVTSEQVAGMYKTGVVDLSVVVSKALSTVSIPGGKSRYGRNYDKEFLIVTGNDIIAKVGYNGDGGNSWIISSRIKLKLAKRNWLDDYTRPIEAAYPNQSFTVIAYYPQYMPKRSEVSVARQKAAEVLPVNRNAALQAVYNKSSESATTIANLFTAKVPEAHRTFSYSVKTNSYLGNDYDNTQPILEVSLTSAVSGRWPDEICKFGLVDGRMSFDSNMGNRVDSVADLNALATALKSIEAYCNSAEVQEQVKLIQKARKLRTLAARKKS